MQTRIKELQRIARVYMAVEHAQSLSLEQAVAAVREAESLIKQRRQQVAQSDVAARTALHQGQHVAWRLHASQAHFTAWNTEGLMRLGRRRQAVMLEAAEAYRTARMQLEQMGSVLRRLDLKASSEREHRMQRESDDRFLSQCWWRERSAARVDTVSSTGQGGPGDENGPGDQSKPPNEVLLMIPSSRLVT